jgi:hypothetical protein
MQNRLSWACKARHDYNSILYHTIRAELGNKPIIPISLRLDDTYESGSEPITPQIYWNQPTSKFVERVVT